MKIIFVFLFCAEDPPVGGTDIDLQLLEAAKAGDMELVKVCVCMCVCVCGWVCMCVCVFCTTAF